jgi:pullulanase
MRCSELIDARCVGDECFYQKDDLGVNCSKKETSVRIWAPIADCVEILLYFKDDDIDHYKKIKLKKDIRGTWKQELSGDWSGYYYLFNIHYGEKIKETIDPYAKAVGVNSKKGLIVNLAKTNPKGWEKDKRKVIDNPVDAIIYELHVRDFSSSLHSGIENKNTYLAFTEEGVVNSQGEKTGVEHLKELGITHVHLLPVFDFASVCDTEKNYNWGYDPCFWNVPEGSYCSDPTNESRIKEFKKLVMTLHNNDIGVIVDVVYNHTYDCVNSVFQKVAPNYFYRFVDDYFANGSGCGNEIATERPMVRKFIIDSVRYWAKEYHVDGFRFDLMGSIDKTTMIEIEKELHDIDSSILIYGEPWSALDPQLEWSNQMKKGSQKGTNIAVFNDNFREAIKDIILKRKDKRFKIKRGVVGAIEYNQSIKDFTASPQETVNYISCHDGLSLWDQISVFYSDYSEEKRIKIDRLAQAVILISQGIPFIQGGEEFLRTKYFNHNSYNAGDYYNQLKWDRKSKYKDTFNYYKGLIELRKKHPAFRMRTARQIKGHLSFFEAPYGAVGFKITGFAEDSWEEIYVFYNFQNDWVKFGFDKKKRFGIVVDDKRAGTKIFNRFKANNVKVPPFTAMVLRGLN